MNDVPETALAAGRAGSIQELAARYFEEYLQKIRLATAELSDQEIWWRPHDTFNSIGNLLLHLRGNLSLWVLAGLGGESYGRDRAAEFTARDQGSREELTEMLVSVVRDCQRTVRELSTEDLAEDILVQGYSVARLDALFHAVEHMSYHTGQIVQTAKQLGGDARSFEFYPRHGGE